jgi:hypothetical protein
MVLGRFRSHGRRLVDELSSIKKLMSLRYSMLARDGLADCGGYGAFGTIVKAHIDHSSGRFSTGRPPAPWRRGAAGHRRLVAVEMCRAVKADQPLRFSADTLPFRPVSFIFY